MGPGILPRVLTPSGGHKKTCTVYKWLVRILLECFLVAGSLSVS